MAIHEKKDPSLAALMSQAVDHCLELQPRLDALGEMVKVVDSGQILHDARVDLQCILKALGNNPVNHGYSGLFQEPSDFCKKGISSVEEWDINPAKPCNDKAYIQLLADLLRCNGRLSNNDWQSISSTNKH